MVRIQARLALLIMVTALIGCGNTYAVKAKDYLWEKKTELGLKGKERRFAVAASADVEAAAVERDAAYIKACLAEQRDKDGNPVEPSYTCNTLLPMTLAAASSGLTVAADELRKQREIYEVLLDPLIGVFSMFARNDGEIRVYAMHWRAVQFTVLAGGGA